MKRGGLYILLYVAILVFMVVLGHFIPGDRETVNAIAIIAANLLFSLIVFVRKPFPRTLFHFCGFSWMVLLLCFLVSVFIAIILGIYFIDEIPPKGESGHLSTSFLSFLEAGIITPISEEILLRGVFLFSLLSSPFFQKRKWGAILISAVVFGLLHFGVYQSLLFLCYGFIWGWLSVSTNSLAPSTIMHVTNNAIVLLIAKYSENNSGLLFLIHSSGIFLRVLLIVFTALLLFLIVRLIGREERSASCY